MPSLVTADGAPVDPPAVDTAEVNREFSRAMASDDPGGVQGPPRHEEKPAEQPKRRPGRPRKGPEDKPRVTDKPIDGPAVKVDKDFTDECAGLSTLAWATLAAVPPTSPYALVIEANQEQLVTALNAGCQQNAKIRASVERWSSGSGGVYALQLAAVGVNMGVQALQLLKDPALRAEAKAHTQEKLRGFLQSNGVKLADPGVSNVDAARPEPHDAPVAA